jgi:hypothetical protein
MSTDAWHDFIKEDEPLRLGIVHTNRLVTFGAPDVTAAYVTLVHWVRGSSP